MTGGHPDAMLARLLTQTDAARLDPADLRALVEEASELGAARALHRLGLDDPRAHGDLYELRELLGAWRDAKKSAWKAVVTWTVRGVLALLLVGIAYRLNVAELLK